MWLLYASLSAVTAALVAIFGKLGLKKIDATTATTVRSVIMAVFLLAFSLLSIKRFAGFNLHTWTRNQWIFIVLAGLAGAASWLFYFAALKAGPADKVVAIDRLSIVLVVVLAAMFLGETITWKIGLGAALMVGGAILLSIK